MPQRFNIHEHMLSTGDFSIKDDAGESIYKVHSKLFTIGDKLLMKDAAGNPLIKIKQENSPKYSITSATTDQELAVVKKIFSLLHSKFAIESIYGNYTLKSPEIMARSFTLEKDGAVVANVSKKLSSFTDCYGVEIVDVNEDAAFILAVVIVLDQYLFDRKSYVGVF